MQETKHIELRQYIKNSFIRSGLSYFGYGFVLSMITLWLGYGRFSSHVKHTMLRSIYYGRIDEYLLILGIGILVIITSSIFLSGIKSFRQFKQFLLVNDVRLVTAHSTTSNLSIEEALQQLNDEELVYENRHLIITSQYIIVLEGDACIQPRHRLKAAYINFHDSKQVGLVQLNYLKTLTLVFENGEMKKVNCHYIEEAKDLLNALSEQGVNVYHGIDSYRRISE